MPDHEKRAVGGRRDRYAIGEAGGGGDGELATGVLAVAVEDLRMDPEVIVGFGPRRDEPPVGQLSDGRVALRTGGGLPDLELRARRDVVAAEHASCDRLADP